MSPRYEPDFSKVTVSFELFSKGDYEFVIGEPTSFQGENRKGGLKVGVRYPIVLAEDTNGHKKGARQMFTCYIHSDGAMSFSKQWLMAALGFNRNEEKKFDAEYASKDWSIDTESKAAGDVWREVNGKRVIISVDQQANPETGELGNTFSGFRPVTTA